MIDLHCHFLPGVDDGARTMDEAVALAIAAVADGVKEAVLTPHVHPRRYANQLSNLKPRLEAFRQQLAQHKVPLRLHLAGEIRLNSDSLDLLDRGELPIMGRWRRHLLVLLEFPHDRIPLGADTAMHYLRKRGIRPMLAHPERNRELMRDWRKLEKFVIEQQCLVQITAGSLSGAFGRTARDTARRFIEADWVTAVASDAHSLRHRPPAMTQARRLLVDDYGEKIARKLTETYPAAIVQGNFNG